MTDQTTPAERTFQAITGLRWPILVAGTIFIVAAGLFLPKLEKDTSADSFIDPDSPALVYRDMVDEIFHLRDPMVIAVVDEGPTGIYNPGTLGAVGWLTERIAKLPNIDPDRVTSLATETNVVGVADGMLVEDFYEVSPDTQERADAIKAAIDDFPLYQGHLVARKDTATLIVAELIDETKSEETYDAVMALAAEAPMPPGTEILVAGEGAVAGYLNSYIDRDAKRLNPLAGLVITVILFIAFRTLRATVLPNLVVLATAVGTFGLMAMTGAKFYVITNALIVVLIGIAVADSIHIFSQYYEEQRARPDATQRELVVHAMAAMWRPVTLTTLTTAAGFLALAVTSEMPPMRGFGFFAAFGVAVAWVYSLTFLPAAMTLLKKGRSGPFADRPDPSRRFDLPGRILLAFGHGVLAHPRKTVAVCLAIMIVGALGASRVIIEEQRIENFKSSEPLYIADKRINGTMDGTYYLDVVVETPNAEDLFQPANLRRVEALQEFLGSLPGVNGVTSIVDYVKQMNRAVNENQPEKYALPDDPLLIAQLFLLYSTSGDPTDFEEEADYDYRRGLVRARVDTGAYTNNKAIVEAAERYVAEHFSGENVSAVVSGRVKVDYHWIDAIAVSHVGSVTVSLLAVWIMASIVFRSLFLGTAAILPVCLSVLLVYAVMGFAGVWLGVGTSMFAAIAIGLGVDFAIHTVDRMRELMNNDHEDLDRRLAELFPTTGRALFFNFAAIALGFGVLVSSDVPPLIKFGSLVAVAISTAFVASMTMLPALAKLLPRGFIVSGSPAGRVREYVRRTSGAGLGVIVLLGASLLGAPWPAAAQDSLSGEQIMRNVVARDEGEWVTRTLRMELNDRRGTTRVREAETFRRYFGDEKRTVLFYVEPENVKGTAFLTYDYADPGREDDQWLYLPALRKIRRISASDRGDYFLGTDFTYEEIKKENKVELSDYTYAITGKEVVDGFDCYVVEGTPADAGIAGELGYGRVVWRIDPNIWISRKSDFWDTNGNHLKTIVNEAVQQIDGVWASVRIRADNHKTGHSSVFIFSNTDYGSEIPERMFEQRTMRRGF
jgi:hydrophobe/amphiphile efflux-3 (HAE3) family protein